MADEQEALWNGPGGNAWVDSQDVLDRALEGFERLLVDAAAGSSSVLDVGCGTGGTTVAVARRVGRGGGATGVDISEPMIAAARARSDREGVPATFVVADAATHPFERETFDAIVSRFGVMFFDDPVAAFSNLRAAAAGGARLYCIVWRDPAENPFMTAAEAAAAPLMPNLPPRDPDAPGQFAFADAAKVTRILEESGWEDVELESIDVECVFPLSGLDIYVTRLGPVGRGLGDLDERTRNEVIARVRAAFEPYVHGDEVRFTAACWAMKARAPGQS